MTRCGEQLNKRAAEGKATVLTELEIFGKLQAGEEMTLSDFDVAVMAFPGDFAGTAAMLLAPVAKRGEFTRAKNIWLNGIPGYPGPAPNERLAVTARTGKEPIQLLAPTRKSIALFKEVNIRRGRLLT